MCSRKIRICVQLDFSIMRSMQSQADLLCLELGCGLVLFQPDLTQGQQLLLCLTQPGELTLRSLLKLQVTGGGGEGREYDTFILSATFKTTQEKPDNQST